MLRKPAASVISIDCGRGIGGPPEPHPQPPVAKRAFFGNQHTQCRFVSMFRHWVNKVARFYRMPPAEVERQIIESIAAERSRAA